MLFRSDRDVNADAAVLDQGDVSDLPATGGTEQHFGDVAVVGGATPSVEIDAVAPVAPAVSVPTARAEDVRAGEFVSAATLFDKPKADNVEDVRGGEFVSAATLFEKPIADDAREADVAGSSQGIDHSEDIVAPSSSQDLGKNI